MEDQELYQLQDGSGVVIGQEIGEDNNLLYIVKQGEEIGIIPATECPIIPKIYSTKGHKTTISIPLVQNT